MSQSFIVKGRKQKWICDVVHDRCSCETADVRVFCSVLQRTHRRVQTSTTSVKDACSRRKVLLEDVHAETMKDTKTPGLRCLCRDGTESQVSQVSL